MAASQWELQGGSQRLGHLEQGPREEGLGGAGGRGAPHSSLLGRHTRSPWTCGHTQAQVHVGLFPGAPGQGRWPPLRTGGWAGAQDHSSNSAAPHCAVCCCQLAQVGTSTLPRHLNQVFTPQVSKAGLSSALAHQRVHAGSHFRLPSTAHLLNGPKPSHTRLLAPGQPPNSATDLRPRSSGPH